MKYDNSHESEYTLKYDIIDAIQAKRIVEIGVLNGEGSRHLLLHKSKPQVLGIDPLIPDSMEAGLIGSMETITKMVEPAKDRFSFIRDYSHETRVIKVVKDFMPDIIFIDGDHTYEAAKQDIEIYGELLRKGGALMVHDSRMGRKGGAPFHAGSSRATKELLFSNPDKWEVFGETFSLSVFIKKYGSDYPKEVKEVKEVKKTTTKKRSKSDK